MIFLQRLRTFPRGLWWVGFFSFFGTCVLGALGLLRTSEDCTALDHYSITTIGDVKRFFLMTFVYAPVIFWLGVRAYRQLRRRWAMFGTVRGTCCYFIVLGFAVFPFQFMGITTNLRNDGIERSICDKSTSNGMFTESVGLTAAEYAHLWKMLPLLPDPPIKPDSVNISYYSDGFLPDFSLSVRCAVSRASARGIPPIGLPPYMPSTMNNPSGWMVDTTGADPKVAWLVFEDGES
jgi:hypothetical protein